MIYNKTKLSQNRGFVFGLFLSILFGIRFIVEYVKESQGGIEEALGILSTGQWLSIPFILLGFVLMTLGLKIKLMDKNYLSIGFKRLLISLFLMFTGPTILFQAFKNESHEWYYYVLVVGLILCLGAILALYSGIMSIIKHIFEKDL